ncbi:hypothetical protein B0H19DRAFT_1123447 [Mycena capillaripes]|nr:hypothetical protein B0H19DRAFT_1123447 [Mycena capillaripes]
MPFLHPHPHAPCSPIESRWRRHQRSAATLPPPSINPPSSELSVVWVSGQSYASLTETQKHPRSRPPLPKLFIN